LDLLLQGADGRIQGRQLPLGAITPEGEHLELALLMATTESFAVVQAAAAANGGEHHNRDHGSEF